MAMDLANSFGGIPLPGEPKAGKGKPATATKKAARPKAEAPAAPAGKAWTRGAGKSSNPAYGRFTVYVPTALRIQAERKWQDITGKDASDLIEHLLTEYVGT